MRHSAPLGALEACGNILSAVIEQQAQRDRDIKIDAQNIGPDGSAKANSSFHISKTLDEAAAGYLLVGFQQQGTPSHSTGWHTPLA